MPSLIQRAFSFGEMSPALYARADLRQYTTGLRTLRNFIIRRHGGVTNRSGTQFLNEVKNSNSRTYLFPFIFNRDQVYLIEAGVAYFRIYQNGVLQDVTGETFWSPTAVYALGDIARRANTNYIAFQASFNKDPLSEPTFWYPMPTGVYEIPTDYTQEELPGIKHVQSNDVMTLVHKNAQPSELRRTVNAAGDIRWIFEAIVFTPSIPAPSTNLTFTAGVAGSTNWRYQVTAVKAETYEESLASAVVEGAGGDPTLAAPNVLAWDVIAGAGEYNVYREVTVDNGVYGFIGVAAGATFSDPKIEPDESLTPPLDRNPFTQILDKPGAVTYSEQRLAFGGSYTHPETVELSRTARFHNFTRSSPLQDDDAISATLAGRTFNEIRHLMEMGNLVVFAQGGEWIIRGNADGVLTPTQPLNAKQETAYGASDVAPVAVGNNVVFVQARSNIVRNLRFVQDSNGYQGSDLTIASNHLFEGFAIERMDFAQTPFSVIGAVRSDGVLLMLTYLPEEEVWGWSRQDTDGAFEEFCVLPEGDEDVMYVIVRRVIQNGVRRYIERFASRRIANVALDAKFLDSHLSYDDGRNLTPTTMTLNSSTAWTHLDLVEVNASAAFFTATDPGNAILLRSNGFEVRVVITEIITGQQAMGYPDRNVPVALQGVAVQTWDRQVDEFAGLDHLEDKTVHVLADGNVTPPKVVKTGKITLDRPHSVVHVGLPYVCDFETLDLDVDDLRDKKKNVRSVSLIVEATRGFFVGPDAKHLMLESMPAHTIDAWHEPPAAVTATIEVAIQSSWEETGRFFVRHLDPLPLTINGAIPRVDVGG